MEAKKTDSLVFFNNVRAFVVVMVVLLHVALAYSNVSKLWWIVANEQTSIIADILCGALDIFLMPILFFISGFFAPSSFEKGSPLDFIKKKGKALLLPWLMGIILLNPFLVFMIRFSRGEPIELTGLTLQYFANFISLYGNPVQDRSLSPYFFSHYHLWYLSLLFYFFIGYMVVRQIAHRFQKESPHYKVGNPGLQLIIRAAMTVALSSVGYAVANYLFGESWFVISVIQFQISRILPYLCFFVFGIYSSRNNWIFRIPSRMSVLLSVIIIPLTLVLLYFTPVLRQHHYPVGLFLYSTFRYLLCLFMLVGLLGIFYGYFNRETLFNRVMNRSSFGLYLVHLDIVAALLYLFRKFPVGFNTPLEMLLILIVSVITGVVLFYLYDFIKSRLVFLSSR